MAESAAPLLSTLRTIVGEINVLTSDADVAPYVSDWRDRYHGRTRAVVRPGTTAEVAAVVRCCAEHGVPIVPQGGNTGLCGGATPDESFFPLSLGAEGSCTIGGNLSTNAGGTAVLRYGNARELVLGLEVVLADGRVWESLKGLRKDNTGYDVKQLFVGSEGTLGIITAAVVKLFPKPQTSATAFAALADVDAAIVLLGLLRQALGDRLTGFELVSRYCIELTRKEFPAFADPLPGSPWYALIQGEDPASDSPLSAQLEIALGAAIEQQTARDATIAHSAAQADALWALREHITEAQRRDGPNIKHDISLPVSRIPPFLREAQTRLDAAFPGVRYVVFGHLGDGNLHYNLSAPAGVSPVAFIAESSRANRIVYDLVAELGGSFSAEHGIGQLKRDELSRYKPAVEVELMRRIKVALDPGGLLNPGKVV